MLAVSIDNRHDELLEYLNQAEALICMAMLVDLAAVKSAVVVDYLWVMQNILQKAKELTEALGHFKTE